MPKQYSIELRELIASMLIRDSSKRPNCEHILGNKYIILQLSKRLAAMGINLIHNIGLGGAVLKPNEEISVEDPPIENSSVENEKEYELKPYKENIKLEIPKDYKEEFNKSKENRIINYHLEIEEPIKMKDHEIKLEKFDFNKYEIKRIKSTKDNYGLNKLDLFKRESSLKDVNKEKNQEIIKRMESSNDINQYGLLEFDKSNISGDYPIKHDEFIKEPILKNNPVEIGFEEKEQYVKENSI